jgi:hypothetical protein
MTTLLPLLALVFAVIGFLLGRPPELSERLPFSRGIATLLVALLGAYAANRFGDAGTKLSNSVGLLVGSILVLLSAYAPKRREAETAYMGLGVTGVALMVCLWPDQIRTSGLALMAGFGFAALTLGDEAASLTAVGGSLIAAATVLGRYGSDEPSYTHAGIAIGLGVCLLGILWQASQRLKAPGKPWTAIVIRILAVGLAFVVGSRYLGLHDAWVSMALGVAAGVAVWAITPAEDVVDPGRSVVATVIWIGLGTLAFGLARGYGMALALALAGGIHLILGEKRSLTTCGPLLGLVLYRIFREAHLDASRALDLGQHYALIGLAIGAALPLLPERWWATKPDNVALQSLGGFLWTLVWAAAPFLAALLLGPKGVVGFVVGVGFSSLFTVSGLAPSLLPLAAAAAAGSLSSLTFGWLEGLTDLTRDEKLHWVLIAVVPMSLVVLTLAGLGMKREVKAVVTAS